MAEKIRNPQQQRSIDKKKRIVEAGYRLFAEKGYFVTNTAEIAKAAGVSTGIVYGYFHDKKDILMEVLDIYIENIFSPMFEIFGNITSPLNLDKIVPYIIDITVQIHQNNAEIHNTLHSLTNSDVAVRDKFLYLEEKITICLFDTLKKVGYCPEYLKEKIHLSMEIIQSYAHERVFDNHSYIDYDIMHTLIVDMVLKLFEK